MEALKGHLEARLLQYPTAKDLCLKILQETMNLCNSYVPMLTAFHKKLLAKVCGEKTCSVALLQACWDVAMGALNVMLDEVHKVRVHTSSTHLIQGPEGLGRFLHVILQELRVLKDFKERMIENHHLAGQQWPSTCSTRTSPSWRWICQSRMYLFA